MNKMNEDETFEYYQNDLDENFKLDKSKVIRRKKVGLSKATVQISLKLEYDLLTELKKEADTEGIGYQTLMKQIIKTYFNDKLVKGELVEIKNRLSSLEDAISNFSLMYLTQLSKKNQEVSHSDPLKAVWLNSGVDKSKARVGEVNVNRIIENIKSPTTCSFDHKKGTFLGF